MMPISGALLLIMWGIRICLATDRMEEDSALSDGEQCDKEAVQMLALFFLKEFENSTCSVCKRLVDLVRRNSLEHRFAKVVENAKEWRDKVERLKEEAMRNPEGLGANSYQFDDWFSEDLECASYIHTLNRYRKDFCNSCIRTFKEALNAFCCRMRSEDLFQDYVDGTHSTDLERLKKSIVWRRNGIVKLYSEYNSKASRTSVMALKMRKDFLEHVKEDSVWKLLSDQKNKFLGMERTVLRDQVEFCSDEFVELKLKNELRINNFMLGYFIEHDKERWETLLKSVKPVLKYEPLASDEHMDSFAGLDDLIVWVMDYVRKQHTKKFQGDREMLFKEDLDFLVSLNAEIKLIRSKNALNRSGIKTSKNNGLRN